MSVNINTSAKAETTAGAARFPLGRLFLTPGAIAALEESGQQPFDFLRRHQSGDWGDLGKEDKRENEFSVTRALRILSKYHTAKGDALYVITESDRSTTTILKPEEY
ncbi:MAG: hypothetical protein QOH49_147 [Acidobacteriota bacterium]|jgi:hypothetical protein|nr:hypothetical protein [Acidobacteriota bacterium]